MPAKFIPSDTERKTVREMASCGTPQADICRVIGISEPTLRRAFRVERDTAAAEANAAVAQSLFRMATDPARPNVAAAIFWLKTRAGWKETPASEPQSNDLDVRSMSLEELEAELQELDR